MPRCSSLTPVKPRPLRTLLPLLVALAAGCGKTESVHPASGAHGGDEGGAAGSGDESTGGSGLTAGEPSTEARYAGVVLAMVTDHDATLSYVARAVFTSEARPTIGGCPRCCCMSTQRGLPFPEKPPDAGEITVLPTAATNPLATLVPDVFEDGSGSFHGMLDLGWSWAGPLSDYPAVPSQPWSADEMLEVVALGNEVEPFSGLVRTGPALEGVTPAIGRTPIVVDGSQPLPISWTPAGNGDATLLLGVPNADGICYCDAPDAAGQLVLETERLGLVSGPISLARLTVSNVANGNASIDLVGAVVRTGTIEVR